MYNVLRSRKACLHHSPIGAVTLKKSPLKILLAVVLLIMAAIACNLPQNTEEPAPSALPGLAPTWTAIVLPDATLTDIPVTTLTGPDISSACDIQTVELLGRQFELKFAATDKPVKSYEYYLANESPDDWFELVEFQIYPVNPDGNQPIDFANRTAAAFVQQYPDMKYALFSDKSSSSVMLDFFYPTSTRKDKDYLEFDAFKYFQDGGSTSVICLHYARNIAGTSAARPYSDVLADIKKARAEVEAALAKFVLPEK